MANKKLFEGLHNATPADSRRFPMGYLTIDGAEYIEYAELKNVINTEQNITLAEHTNSIDFLNLGLFKNFDPYTEDRSDATVAYQSRLGDGTVSVYNYYQAFVSMQLMGFDETKPHKISMVRRGDFETEGEFNYSIIISAFNGSDWVRAMYIVILTNIETSGSVVKINHTVDHHSANITIDYSLLPAVSQCFLDGDEVNDPIFVISNNCFVGVDSTLITNLQLSINPLGLKNIFNPCTARENYIVEYPTGVITSWAGGKSVVTEYIVIPADAVQLYINTDQTNYDNIYIVFKNDTDDATGGEFKYGYSNSFVDIPHGFTYVVVTVARVDGINNAIIDYNNIVISFVLDNITTKNLVNDVKNNKAIASGQVKIFNTFNLPQSADGTGIKTGYAYIDSSNNIKIK